MHFVCNVHPSACIILKLRHRMSDDIFTSSLVSFMKLFEISSRVLLYLGLRGSVNIAAMTPRKEETKCNTTANISWNTWRRKQFFGHTCIEQAWHRILVL